MTNNEEFEKILENIDENGPEPQEEPQRQYYFMKKARAILKQKAEELGRPLTACTVTFGCQMNARDSEKLIGILEKIGYVMTEDEHADFVIYNTCTVRENANQRVYGRLGALNSMKKEKSAYADRSVRLYDAGAGSCRKTEKELPFRGSDFWNTQYF